MLTAKITRQGVPQGDSKFEFGQGKFAHQKNALKALDDAFDYAIDQLKRKKRNDSMIDVARCLLAETMALTFQITDQDEAVLFIATTDALWRKRFLPAFDEITDKKGFQEMPHENWCVIAFAHNIKRYLNDKRRKATIQQAFVRMKWGALEKYLDPHKYEWTSNYGTCHNCFI